MNENITRNLINAHNHLCTNKYVYTNITDLCLIVKPVFLENVSLGIIILQYN